MLKPLLGLLRQSRVSVVIDVFAVVVGVVVVIIDSVEVVILMMIIKSRNPIKRGI